MRLIAKKCQTYIEPIIDVWTRAKEQQNVVINDPKGELYVKFFYPMRKRGMDTIVFNLMDSTHTNIYNPLGYAVQAARQGDYGKMEDFINNVGNVFFPTEGADDPMWPNAAAATFKRSALGLIDYYMEEEAEMRSQSVREKWSADLLARRLDVMWGRVTLYNIYQMMVSLASKKSSDEALIKFDDETDVEEKDYLSLFFDATERLPQNPLRQAAINNNRTLRTMAGSDKTIASVYGIAMSTMLFFTDDKIARLTSGRPSQNFDMEGLSFPRRIGVRFDTDYTLKHGLNSQVIRWQVYEDPEFKKPYKGSDFTHNGTIVNGWARATFKGKFKNAKTYLKLTILDRDTVNKAKPLRIGTYFFEFDKSYERGLSGKTYIKDPVTHDFVVKDGNLIELARIRDKKTGKIRYDKKSTLIKFTRKSLQTATKGETITDKKPLFQMVDVHYTERTKGIFLVTPPSKMQYSKLILIMLSQSFDINVDASYMTKENQKPLYKTKYILDEFGNLQSEGKGIPFLQTKESIGLGQEQQYTLILQTLQQLRDVYGDSIDKILQGNTANIVYLKSNDASMLDTLIELGGVRHESRRSSKSVTEHAKKLFADVEDSVSYTTSTSEVPVIQKNDMLFIQKGNNMVFRLGENPLWSKNQLAMPFAHALHSKLFPESPDYSLMTVPTPSNTDDFDILGNIPDWVDMVEKRVRQARIAQEMITRYTDVYDLGPDGMQRLDPELVSIELMVAVNEHLHLEDRQAEAHAQEQEDAVKRYQENREDWEVDPDDIDFSDNDFPDLNLDFDENWTGTEVEDLSNHAATHEALSHPESNQAGLDQGINLVNNSKQNETFLGGSTDVPISRQDFVNQGAMYDGILSNAYDVTRRQFEHLGDQGWQVKDDGSLFHDGVLFMRNEAEELDSLKKNNNVNVVEDDDTSQPDIKWEPTHEFKSWLIKKDNAVTLVDGKFYRELRKQYARHFGSE